MNILIFNHNENRYEAQILLMSFFKKLKVLKEEALNEVTKDSIVRFSDNKKSKTLLNWRLNRKWSQFNLFLKYKDNVFKSTVLIE
jgi:hypothetical protein